MSLLRLVGIPIDLIEAEIAAFPVASEASFALGFTELDPLFVGEPGAKLWKSLEYEICKSFPAISLDEIGAIRDKVWFNNPITRPVSLLAYVRSVAKTFLQQEGSVATPRLTVSNNKRAPHSTDQEGRRRWRWMSFSLPADLLIATLDEPADGGERVHAVEALSPLLNARLKDEGFAESHLHLGAAMSFPELWVSTVFTLSTNVKATLFRSPGAAFTDGQYLGSWLLRACLVRWILARFLKDYSRFPNVGQFLFLDQFPRIAETLGHSFVFKVTQCIEALQTGVLSSADADFESIRFAYAELTGLSAIRKPRGIGEFFAADPIARDVGYFVESPYQPELLFLRRAFAYTEARPGDVLFKRLLWQIVRLRCLFFRHVVQRPARSGLQWFTRFYSRIAAGKKLFSYGLLIQSALRLGGTSQGLRSLEVRISPKDSVNELFASICEINSAAVTYINAGVAEQPRANVRSGRKERPATPYTSGGTAIGDIELAVVLHFTKKRWRRNMGEVANAYWRMSNADPTPPTPVLPGGNSTGYRYADFYLEKQREARAVGELFQRHPEVLKLVRGIDICSDEVGISSWVLVGLVKEVRERAQDASRSLAQTRGENVPALRTTIHVGEDFVHLLSGLRAVDEVIRYYDLKEGDRIGHALALGVDVQDWVRRAGRVPICLEDRLLDLVWEWAWYGCNQTEVSDRRHLFLEAEISRLSKEVFGKQYRPQVIIDLVDELHRPQSLDEIGFPNQWTYFNEAVPRHLRFMWRYLTDGMLFTRGRVIEWVEPETEKDALTAIQAGIRQNAAMKGITVEVNPSSNLLIGDLGDLTHHPLWRLFPPSGSGDVPPVAICLGSDDPVTFATNTRQEYQLVYDALLSAGLGEQAVRDWVDRVRKNGLDARFSLREWNIGEK